jgi:hypothetical protein
VAFARLDWGNIMRGVVKVVVILLLALVAGGLVLSAVAKARMAAQGAEGHNNLRALGLAVLNYHDAYGGKFPTGTAPDAALPPTSWQRGPMTFWVHAEADGRPWHAAEVFDPPAPGPIPGKGYPRFFVEVGGFPFEFASLAERDVGIATLARKALPATDRETQARGTGPSPHWRNRLPPGTHPWRYRQKAVKVLREAREHFEAEVGAG